MAKSNITPDEANKRCLMTLNGLMNAAAGRDARELFEDLSRAKLIVEELCKKEYADPTLITQLDSCLQLRQAMLRETNDDSLGDAEAFNAFAKAASDLLPTLSLDYHKAVARERKDYLELRAQNESMKAKLKCICNEADEAGDARIDVEVIRGML